MHKKLGMVSGRRKIAHAHSNSNVSVACQAVPPFFFLQKVACSWSSGCPGRSRVK